MQSSPKSIARRPRINSAAEPHATATPVAARHLEQNGSETPSEIEKGHRAAATTPDCVSELSDRLAALPTLSLGDLRLEWWRLFRADPPSLSRDMMLRAIAFGCKRSHMAACLRRRDAD